MPRLIDSSGLTSFAIPGGKIVTSVISQALKIEIKTAAGNDPSPAAPLIVAFPTLSSSGASFSGRYITTPLSMTVAGNSLGLLVGQNQTPFRVWLILIDDDGTPRIGIVNCSQINKFLPLDEWKPISSTIDTGTIGTGSTGVVYTNTVAVTNKPFRIIGFLTFNSGFGANSGIWQTTPDVIQMFGAGIPRPGQLVQSASTFDVSGGTGAAIPFDNTIPQISEGQSIFSVPYAAQSPANWIEHDLLIQGGVNYSAGSGLRLIGALFQDSVADAIAAGAIDFLSASAQGQLRVMTRTLAGSQGTSFSARIGFDTAYNTGTISLGGTAALGPKFNGTMYSGYIIKEYMG